MDNDRIAVEIKRLGGCEVELSVLVKPEATQSAYQEALKWVRQRVSLPGFRKGKAPVATVKKQYADSVEERWHDHLTNTAAREALALTEIYPWSGQGVPQPKVESISMDEGAKFLFHFEAEPEIPTVNKEDVKVEKVFPEEVTEAMVDKEIDVLRGHHATYETVEEPAEEGGFVSIDVESLAGDELTKVVDNHRVELVKGKAADWLRNMVVGHKAEDVVEGETGPDEDASDEEKKAFERRNCRVTLRSVEKQVPQKDEALVESTKAESMEDLRKKMHERLEHELKEKAENETKQKLWDVLFEKYPFECPKSLFEAEEKTSIERMIKEARSQGATDDQIVAREKEVEARAKQEVAHKLHAIFLSRKIVQELGEQPTDKELSDRALQLLMWEAISQGKMAPSSPDPRLLEAYRHHAFLLIVREKAEQHFLS